MKDRAVDLSEEEQKNFLTFPDEKIFILKRAHHLTLMLPIIFSSIAALVVIGLIYLLAVLILHSTSLFIGLTLLTLVAVINLITKAFIDYYFHFYVVTNRKILEMLVIPLFRDKINDVLLDQVRITEIDIRMPSVIHGIFDMGDVIIEFDRPSHLELFTLNNIANPREIGKILTRELQSVMHDSPVWFTPRTTNQNSNIQEDDDSPTGEVGAK